jgi:hypothetical protein
MRFSFAVLGLLLGLETAALRAGSRTVHDIEREVRESRVLARSRDCNLPMLTLFNPHDRPCQQIGCLTSQLKTMRHYLDNADGLLDCRNDEAQSAEARG